MVKYLKREVTDRVVDVETGEVLDVHKEKTFGFSVVSEPFLATYVRGLGLVYGINNVCAFRLLFRILEMTKFNSSRIDISSPTKRRIMEELGVSLSSYNKAMKCLMDAGIVSGGRGLYEVSPEVFWCGDSKTRSELLDGRKSCEITFRLSDANVSNKPIKERRKNEKM